MKWVKYIEYVLLGLSVVAIASLFFLPGTDFQGKLVANPEGLLYWTYVILGIGVIAALISPIKNLFTSPKSALRALIGLVVVAVLIGGSYLLSSAEPIVNSAGGFFEGVFDLRFTDTVLFITYAIGIVSVLTVVATEIRNAFK